MVYEHIIYEKEGELAIVKFNRPDVLNALNYLAIDEALDVVRKAEADEVVRVLIITGTGDKDFISGTDIGELQQRNTLTELGERSEGRRVLTNLLETMSKPTIAAINGFAIGTGMEIALACTLRIASDTARFGLPEINLGIMPGNGGTQRLPRLVGKGQAMEMVLTGELIDAVEAYRIGLVNQVVPLDELMDYTKQLAAKLTSKSPLALKIAKDTINTGLNLSLAEGIRYEQKNFAILCGSEDKKEGVAAFLEKRSPIFQGR
ncbi:enoyl-CoA hydratase/isomerase family protein [Chloroflexota bacterium]